MSLRELAVIDMAAAYYPAESGEEWHTLGHNAQIARRRLMNSALDALLLFLTEHTEEWTAVTEDQWVSALTKNRTISAYLAVLAVSPTEEKP